MDVCVWNPNPSKSFSCQYFWQLTALRLLLVNLSLMVYGLWRIKIPNKVKFFYLISLGIGFRERYFHMYVLFFFTYSLLEDRERVGGHKFV